MRLGAMGDVIHALPAVAALRQALPDATVGWVIEKRWSELLLPQLRLVDNIHTVDTRGWRSALLSHETWKEASAAMEEIRKVSYDIVIDVQGAWKSALIAQLSGAPRRIGFAHPREYGAGVFYTQQVETRAAHIIEKNIQLVAALIGDGRVDSIQANRTLEWATNPAAEDWAEGKLSEHGLEAGRFAIINPGAGWGAKCWPAENYGAVARGLTDLGIGSVINFGPGEEGLANKVVSASAGSTVAFPCAISELIALTRRAGVFVGGDTGPMHLAAALRIPVVGIFGPTDPARNGPFGTDSIVLRRTQSVTDHSRRGGLDRSMLTITPAEVLDAARSLLDKAGATQEVRHA